MTDSTESPTLRAALYCRISKDPEEQRLGVDRQVETGRRIAAEREYVLIGDPIVDNDKSAFLSVDDEKAGKADRRPGFARLRQLIESRDVDVVVAQHQDRYARNTDTWSDLAKLAVIRGVRLETWSGAIDITSAAGFLSNGMQALVDHHYSLQISEKTRAAHAGLVSRGLPNGGRRPFGYRDRVDAEGSNHRTLDVDETEAELIRSAAADVLAGRSMLSIVGDWNDRGIPTTTGRRWKSSVLHRILVNPRLAGLRTYNGEIVGTAAWPAVLDRVTWERVRAVLTSGDRRRRPHTTELRYWLRGLAVCGVDGCGSLLTSATEGGTGRRVYRCPPKSTGDGCGRIKVGADSLETYVAGEVLDLFDRYRADLLSGADAGDDVLDAIEALVELEARERQIGEGLAAGTFTVAIAQTASTQITAERARLQALIANDSTAPDDVEVPADVAAVWPDLTAGERRTVAAVVVDRVVVGPGRPGRAASTPDRTEIVPRQAAVSEGAA